MENIKDSETRATIEDSGTPNSTKYGDWLGYHKHDRKSIILH